MFVFFFKQKTAYEMRISDWSSDVCSSDLINGCKVVLPADRFDGASLQQLIQEEEVTFSGGVPTIWTMYLNHLERTAETWAPPPSRYSTACTQIGRAHV